MKYGLRTVGFATMILGLGGLAEMEKIHIALLLIIAGAITLAIDSVVEDANNEKYIKNHRRNMRVGIDARYPSYLH